MMVIGCACVMSVPQVLRMQMIFGQTWLVCPWFVLGLSIPTIMALLVGARRLAPTNLKVAEFTIGLLVGSVGRLLAPSVLRW
jgi:hypothetical protein